MQLVFGFVVLSSIILLSESRHTYYKRDHDNLGIIDGNVASHKPQYLVNLQRSNGVKSYPVCGGTLIARNLVLTAAHCLTKNSSLSVVAGLLYTDVPEVTDYRRKVIAQYMYPNWTDAVPNSDLGAVLLDEPFPMNIAEPTQLPTAVNAPAGAVVTEWGWGKTSNVSKSGSFSLMTAQATVVDCKKEAICLNGKACNGDSGSPLTATYGQNEYVIGLAVSVLLSGRCGSNTTTTGVTDYYANITSDVFNDFKSNLDAWYKDSGYAML